MKRRKPKTDGRAGEAKKARRQARIVIGPPPPAKVIEPGKGRRAKHKKKAAPEDQE